MTQETRKNSVEDNSLEEEGSSLIRVESLPSPGENLDPVAGEELIYDQNVNNVNLKPKSKNKFKERIDYD